MRLYFLRHGPAGASADFRGPDSERPLTDKGRETMRAVVARLAEAGAEFDRVLTSPYARAAQTASIVVEGLGMDVAPTAEPLLRPGLGLAGLRGILDANRDVERLVLVGHEPDFSEVVGALIGGARVRLKKGGLARVDIDDPARLAGMLVWLVQPDLLAR